MVNMSTGWTLDIPTHEIPWVSWYILPMNNISMYLVIEWEDSNQAYHRLNGYDSMM